MRNLSEIQSDITSQIYQISIPSNNNRNKLTLYLYLIGIDLHYRHLESTPNASIFARQVNVCFLSKLICHICLFCPIFFVLLVNSADQGLAIV